MQRALCMLVALGATLGQGADFKGEARVWTGAGVDSNPRRDLTSEGVFVPWDAFGSVVVSGVGVVQTDWGRLIGSYDFGGRKFFFLSSEDTVINAAMLDGSVAVGRYFAVGLTGRVRDRRGAERDYTDLDGEGTLEFAPDAALDLKLHGGAHRFLYQDRLDASFYGPAFGLTGRYRLNKRHSVFFFGDFEPRSYNAIAFVNPGLSDPPPPVQRHDAFISVGAGYTFRGPFQLTVQYAYLDSSSNGYGETFTRHRFSATAGFRLPLELTLIASGAVQVANYPDGIYLSSDLIVKEDDENANNFSIKLVRPLGPHFDLDLKYAVYFNRLPANDLTYLRMVGSLGLGWHW